MNVDKLKKLEAHTDSLLTLLIQTYSQYLFLRPMMFNAEVIARFNTPDKRAGFEHFRHVLYRTLVLEVVKLCDDSDVRTPSIAGLRRELSLPEVETFLEDRYSQSAWPRLEGETEESYARGKADDSAKSRARFRETFSRFMMNSEKLLSSPEILALKKLRDKQLAHNELQFINGEYRFVPVEELKYGDERKVLEVAQTLIEQLTSIVRQTSFSWASFYEPEVKSVCAYWDIDSLAAPIVS